jgi:hypothetical protein
MNEAYREQVRLMLDLPPFIANESVFAPKGGTAINVFAELLDPEAKDQRQTFAGEFAGMTLLPFDYAVHEATFAELTAAARASLTPAERTFLVGFEEGSPDWSLFPATGAERLPAPRWKLLNIQKLRSKNPAKHAAGLEILRGVLGGTDS